MAFPPMLIMNAQNVIHRQSAGKDMVVIYDYLDASLPTLERMFGRRAKANEALGYSVGEGEVSTLVQGKLGQATPQFASQE